MIGCENSQSIPKDAMKPDRQSYRILIVDDNLEAGELLQMMLEMQGYDVHVACDGQAALADARTFRPDIVLSDIVMPGMSGYELAAALRREELGARTLIIAISGYTGNYSSSEKDASQFDAFLTKPVAYGDICARLDAHLQQSAGQHA